MFYFVKQSSSCCFPFKFMLSWFESRKSSISYEIADLRYSDLGTLVTQVCVLVLHSANMKYYHVLGPEISMGY